MAATHRQIRLIYLVIALILTATAIRGFWPGYFGPALRGGVEHFWFIHVHAAVFLVWMLLLSVQAILVTSGNVQMHRRIGAGVAAWGGLVVVVGWFISIAAPVARVQTGQLQPPVAELVALYNLTDMAIFTVMFGLAIYHRSTPALHRRLIICAGIALTGAAVGRMLSANSLGYLAVWLAPYLLAVTSDLLLERRVHFVYLAGGAAFLFMFLKVRIYSMSDIWQSIAAAVTGPFL